MDYISVKEAAKHWNLSERTIRYYAREGRIDDAVKEKGE